MGSPLCSFRSVHCIVQVLISPVIMVSATAQAPADTTSQAPCASTALLATELALVVAIVVGAVVGVVRRRGALALSPTPIMVAITASLLAFVPTLAVGVPFLLHVLLLARCEEAARNLLKEPVGDLLCAVVERLERKDRHGPVVPPSNSGSLPGSIDVGGRM